MAQRRNSYRVALLLKAKGAYGRDVVAGVADYVQLTRVVWDFHLYEDFRGSIAGIRSWSGDGFIVDFDDPSFEDLFSHIKRPVVAVGGSYEREIDYPAGIPYVATDNFALVSAAYDHLIDMGLARFAFYSQPPANTNRWAREREKAYVRLCRRDGLEPLVFTGRSNDGLDWDTILIDLVDWLKSLPKPIGVIAVTDARARQVLQACILSDIAIPEEVALVGIDDDMLLRMLGRIPLSSVRQGTREMGRLAASMLHRRLAGDTLDQPRILVPPAGLNALASSHHQPTYDPYVMRARHFIRQFAAQGAKVSQVADYVGVSRATLDNHFRKAFDHTTHDDMLAFRLDLAKRMLTETGLGYPEIAERAGFTSLPYMYAVFRREVGCTPKEYRDGSRGSGGGMKCRPG
jgi:LacI family transcriptional regulator